MSSITMTPTVNTARLDRLIALVTERADQLSDAAARDLVAYVGSHWSPSSPSAPGSSPAVRSGTLSRSVILVKVADGTYQVRVDAQYARFLEYGTKHMAARPFWHPAIIAARFSFRQRFAELLQG